MEYNLEEGKRLVDELLDLYSECQKRCDRIEEIIEKLDEQKKRKEICP